MLHAVGDVQNMRKGHLDNTVSGIGRDCRYRDAAAMGSLNIDVVVACCQFANIFQFGQLSQYLIGDITLIGQDSISTLGMLHELIRSRTWVYRQFSKFF